jgi:hypothetical protein
LPKTFSSDAIREKGNGCTQSAADLRELLETAAARVNGSDENFSQQKQQLMNKVQYYLKIPHMFGRE